MANIKSQLKRNRQTVKRTEKNKSVKSELKTRIKSARNAIEAQSEDAQNLVSVAVSKLDTAASNGVIHKNQAANRKSALMKFAKDSKKED